MLFGWIELKEISERTSKKHISSKTKSADYTDFTSRVFLSVILLTDWTSKSMKKFSAGSSRILNLNSNNLYSSQTFYFWPALDEIHCAMCILFVFINNTLNNLFYVHKILIKKN